MAETKEQYGGHEWARVQVPREARKSVWDVMAVWIGWSYWAGVPLFGALVAAQMPLASFITATVVACVILGLIASLTGGIAQRTGLSYGLLTRCVFGQPVGTGVASLFFPPINLGFDAILLSLTARTVMALFGFPQTYFVPLVLLFAALFCETAIGGFRYMVWLSRIAVPAMTVIGIVCLVRGLAALGAGAAAPVAAQLPMITAISMIMGGFTFGAATAAADVQRFSRSFLQSTVAGFGCFAVAYAFLTVCGGITGSATGNPDFVLALKQLGLLAPGAAFLIASAWSSADNDYYSSSLAIVNVTGWKRPYVVILCAAVAALGAVLGIAERIQGWLLLCAAAGLPIGAVLWADYYVVHRGRYPALDRLLAALDGRGRAKVPSVRWSALLGVVIGWVVGFFSQKYNVGFPALQGAAAAFLGYLLLVKILSQEVEAD